MDRLGVPVARAWGVGGPGLGCRWPGLGVPVVGAWGVGGPARMGDGPGHLGRPGSGTGRHLLVSERIVSLARLARSPVSPRSAGPRLRAGRRLGSMRCGGAGSAA